MARKVTVPVEVAGPDFAGVGQGSTISVVVSEVP
jgi:hypothetical protein